MWMAYVDEVEVVDLESGVKYLSQLFSNLRFDAEHEAVYGMGRFFTEEECNNLATKYEEGRKICQDFLMREICEDCLVSALLHLNLSGFERFFKAGPCKASEECF